MKWRYHMLTCFTLTILFAGVLSILKCAEGDVLLAAKLVLLAGVLDGLDGSLARRVRGATDFGARLDTYVDPISFGVAPALLAYTVLSGGCAGRGAAAALVIVSAGVLRFARGCEWPDESGRHIFRGLPIPVSGVWIALFALLAETGTLARLGALGARLALGAMWLFTILFLLLQLSNVRYVKPRKEFLAAGMALALVILLAFGYAVGLLCLIICLALLAYALTGPFLDGARRRGRRA
ncbi:MAG: CDP-alcohol phosphatidyltransferase family protein [Lentisphaerae bacterium]|nr:CDP-alcohol phosphatidyltransferase family protein [Lentisphaerota bacterium]